MVDPAQPLNLHFPIVDPQTGSPTEYFIRWAQQFSGSAGSSLEAIQEEIDNLGLNDLVDVDTVTNPPSNNQVLTWDSGDGLWVPKTGSGGGGWTPTTPLVGQFTHFLHSGGIGAPSIQSAPWNPGVESIHPRNTSSSHRQSFIGFAHGYAPGTNFRVEAKIAIPNMTTNNYPFDGIAILDSLTNRNFDATTYYDSGSDYRYQYNANSDLDTQDTGSIVIDRGTAAAYWATASSYFWFAIEYNASSGEISQLYSVDGYAWFRGAYIPTSFFANYPDLVGFWHKSVSSNSGDEVIHCVHFKVTDNLSEPLGLNT